MTWRRARVAVGAATAVIALAAPALGDVSPSPSPAAPPLPVAVTLVAIKPIAPQPGNKLTIRGTLRNVSPSAVSELQVRVLVSRSQIGSRSAFDSYAAQGPTGPFPADAFVVPTARVTMPTTTLPPASTEPFKARLPVDDLHLPAGGPWQVHTLGVDVTGLTSAGNQTVGRLHTFLPWAPVGVPGVGLPTQVAWIWPLIDRPHRTAAPAWRDDTLADAFRRSGRLWTLVAAGAAAESQRARTADEKARRTPGKPGPAKSAARRPRVTPVPVTWAVDPMLVEDAIAMTSGYRVHTRHGNRPGSGQAAAKAWLAAMRSATDRGSVLEVPYGDPDIVAAVHGDDATAVQGAITSGQTLLTQALRHRPLTYVWPPAGLMDQRTLNTVFAGGVSTVVLDDTALPILSGAQTETPSAHATLTARDGTLDALLVDSRLSAAVQDGADNPADATLDVQRVLSELLMIQAELPSDQRTIVIAPNRRWNPTPGYATALLTDSGRVPWIAPVSLSDALASPVYDKVQRSPLVYPPAARHQELPRPYVRSVARLEHNLDSFTTILPAGDQKARTFEHALLRLLSSRWRNDLDTARKRRDEVAYELNRAMAQVRIASGNPDSKSSSLVTLTSHSGTVPVTVANDLDVPVRVVVGINGAPYLRVAGNGRVTRTIPARRRVVVDLRASAQTSGVFPLTVTLYTPSLQRYGEPVQLLVRSTAYGVTALGITVGATAALLVAVGVRLFRRSRAARRHARRAV